MVSKKNDDDSNIKSIHICRMRPLERSKYNIDFERGEKTGRVCILENYSRFIYTLERFSTKFFLELVSLMRYLDKIFGIIIH